MSKKILLVLLTLLIVIATLLASCNGKDDPGNGDEVEEIEDKIIDTSEEKPQYGGIANLRLASDISTFDEAFGSQSSLVATKLTNEELLTGDWAKGPAGTGEADFLVGSINDMALKTGCLADSWEMPEKGVIIFHIREGVYWHDKAPTNGRELTVEDVVFSFNRMCTEPGAYVKQTYPTLCKDVIITGDEATRTVTVDATNCPSDMWVNVLNVYPDYLSIMPKDAIEYYGDLNDWKNNIGTGPFILTDFVSNGSATFERNDNYWGTNPCGPGQGDQLPYLDGVKMLIISDTATAATAFRTMQVDSFSGEYDDVKEFIENPDMQYISYVSENSWVISMRTDKPDSPLSKKEVRQALTLAMDYDKIKNEYYGGRAEILVWPLSYVKEYEGAYVPMEDLPASVQELYSYDVDRAQDLLTEAGYPTGFDASIICYNYPTYVDYLSVVQDMWSKIGVNVTLDAKDLATYTARVRAKNYDDMIFFYNSANWQKMQNFTGTSIYNMSYVNDAYCNEQASKAMDLIAYDDAQVAKINADIMPYVLEKCWVVPRPTPYTYLLWWPWVKNYHGELNIGLYNSYHHLKYRWNDETLKEQLTQ